MKARIGNSIEGNKLENAYTYFGNIKIVFWPHKHKIKII